MKVHYYLLIIQNSLNLNRYARQEEAIYNSSETYLEKSEDFAAAIHPQLEKMAKKHKTNEGHPDNSD